MQKLVSQDGQLISTSNPPLILPSSSSPRASLGHRGWDQWSLKWWKQHQENQLIYISVFIKTEYIRNKKKHELWRKPEKETLSSEVPCCHLKREHEYLWLFLSNLLQNVWNKSEQCWSAIAPVQLLTRKWKPKTCLMPGHLFSWRSHSLLRSTGISLTKLTPLRDNCSEQQRTLRGLLIK